jgi:protein-S-isoprenylcysteine O-methyltransferase Ste14
MALREELQHSGLWLFRHRSFLPLALVVLLPPAAMEIMDGRYAFRWSHWWGCASIAVCIAGLLVRCVAVGYAGWGTSGRNTRGQKAESVNTTGLYSLVRHPLYLGNYLLFLGGVMFLGVWWLPVLASMLYWVYYERIMFAEEEYLRAKFGRSFTEWADRTPAFIPRLRGWRRPPAPFQIKKALTSEYPTVLGVAAWFFAADLLLSWLVERQWRPDPVWSAAAAAGLLFYMVVRALMKFTKVLQTKRTTPA